MVCCPALSQTGGAGPLLRIAMLFVA